MTTTESPEDLVAALLSPGGKADPYPVYRQLRSLGPVIRVFPRVTVVTGYEAARTALCDPRLLVEDADRIDLVAPGWRRHASRMLLGNAMLFANGAAHDRMRRLVRAAFTARQIDALGPSIARWVAVLTDELAAAGDERGVVEFVEEFAVRLPMNVTCDLLGVPNQDRPALRAPITVLARAVEPGWAQADLTAADAAATDLGAYFADLLDQRRRCQTGDLLSAMITAGESTTDELVSNAVFLLLAGFETTVGLLGNGLLALLDRPAAAARLRTRPELAAAFVEEILRYDPPVQLTSRFAAAELVLDETVVPRGTSVIVLIAAANRDPARFTDPEAFEPARPGNRPLSLGSGVHYCLGAQLARLQARIALPTLFARFPGLAAAGAPARLDRLTLRCFQRLPIVLGTCPPKPAES